MSDPTTPPSGAMPGAMSEARLADLARVLFELYAPGDPQWYPYDEEHWLKDAETVQRVFEAECATLRAQVQAGREAICDYNALLRSAHDIAHRAGDQTNWRAFREQLLDVLDKHHATFVAAHAALALPEPSHEP